MTDGMLMCKVKEGDLSKAAVLFERYHRKIYHFLGKMSGDYHTAEDLTQTVFEKLIHNRQRFDEDQNFEGWIYKIARNTFIDHYHAGKKLSVSQVDPAVMHDAAEEASHDEEMDARLQVALGRLSESDREILILTRFQKLKYIEVASMLSTTEANVKIKVFRAIDKLRTLFFQTENI